MGCKEEGFCTKGDEALAQGAQRGAGTTSLQTPTVRLLRGTQPTVLTDEGSPSSAQEDPSTQPVSTRRNWTSQKKNNQQ